MPLLTNLKQFLSYSQSLIIEIQREAKKQKMLQKKQTEPRLFLHTTFRIHLLTVVRDYQLKQ